MDTHRKEIIIFIIFALIAIAGVILFLVLKKGPSAGPSPVVTNVDPGQTPNYFPAVPIPSDVKIINNYNSVNPNGRVQATRTFESPKTVEANFTFYKQFLSDTKNGWKIVSEVNTAADPAHRTIFAENNDGVLTINISIGRTPETSLVDVTFLKNK